MRNQTSRSAEHVALFRALETARRRDRVVDDPYAKSFLTGTHRLAAGLARVPALGRRIERYLDRRWPAGPRASAVARTRLIDDLTLAALDHGARQVVLLGAGFDSRPYRLPGIGAARVFEVDHPATQATKKRLLHPSRREHVRFVPVDLITGDLAAALRAAGFAPLEPTVVVWEGVTNYLTAAAVDATMRLVADSTASGSELIFTYVDRAALTGDVPGVAEWHAVVRAGGEPWTFGFDPAELPGYVAARGMRLALDRSARDAAREYLAPLGRHEPAAEFYRIAKAEIL
ncbi:SAM-dependent methyltransferase [Actinoplanes sp. L3-i22]|uniref:class I SAM-dependent methyltransferase n=1 Tax=Actinoplanes sp. L3-i22 TaxID=2836373 RepID=UPI001C7935FF|nr:SAM-dependent methyltransferase [Actinoplanes sp. L3-i22]BCY07683.1 SAM-dependent methyltransferase [Actinoplanes sp. L3-i22]